MDTVSGKTTSQSNAPLAFKLPRDSQSLSRLVQLPTELRLVILRLLLRFRTCDAEKGAEVENIREHLKRGVRLMQTCQTLYVEGSEILFNENTMCYHVEVDWPCNSISFSSPILNIRHHTHGEVLDMPFHLEPTARLHDACFHDSWFVSQGNDIVDMYSKEALEVLFAVTKFQCFKSIIYPEVVAGSTGMLKKAVFLASLLFQDILREKSLTIGFALPRTYDLLREDPYVLDGCRILRCTSITVAAPFSISSSLSEHLAAGDAARDTYKEWFSFMEDIVNALPDRTDPPNYRNYTPTGCSFLDEYIGDLEKLHLTAERYDGKAYDKELKVMLHSIDEWMAQWWQYHYGKLLKGITRVQGGTERYRQIIGNSSQLGFNLDFDARDLVKACGEQRLAGSETSHTTE